ncbi:MAG TPA: ABC transporter substrate-binding protein, partial [Candidatus Flavonifractor intestinipullorum]|nr:ABC transporter substrate-binding protein [Candidatus Flavonifractor intestinipullorum]
MKRTHKWTAAALSAALMVSLAACSGGGTTSTPSSAPSQNGGSGDGTSSGESYVVGICQLAPHDALDAATQGFKDALTERFGESVKFSEGNAGGDSNNCITIVDGFLSEGVDLILANATASLTAAQSATDTIPILGTAITNYGVALNLDTTE